MRIPQQVGTRGSLKWMQRLANEDSALLTSAVRQAAGYPAEWDISWVSPRRDDEYSEYRDDDFLSVLGLSQHATALSSFWPTRGPQWDALGRTNEGGVVLVEAKAHIPELQSHCAAESPRSVEQIRLALDQAKTHFGALPPAEWLSPHYQYANRLAHLAFLRKAGVRADLVFLYVVGDSEMRGPGSRTEWEEALRLVYSQLGLNRFPPHVMNVFIDVSREDQLAAV